MLRAEAAPNRKRAAQLKQHPDLFEAEAFTADVSSSPGRKETLKKKSFINNLIVPIIMSKKKFVFFYSIFEWKDLEDKRGEVDVMEV